MTIAAPATKPSLATIWRSGVLAAAVSAVGNAMLYFVGAALGGFPTDVLTPLGYPITVAPVLIMSIVPVLLGALGYTILSRLPVNPNLWFTVITVVIFVAMFFNPLSLPGAPALMIVLLEVMHVVTAGSAVYFLTRS
ncbi:MAG: hypothetical protein DCC55_37775 [Chloroflexi bacterium]|nr:MAG: hypothetical protein DCC55_37775 [Chloroflexota bacterium]